jgi:hypothetical protein
MRVVLQVAETVGVAAIAVVAVDNRLVTVARVVTVVVTVAVVPRVARGLVVRRRRARGLLVRRARGLRRVARVLLPRRLAVVVMMMMVLRVTRVISRMETATQEGKRFSLRQQFAELGIQLKQAKLRH